MKISLLLLVISLNAFILAIIYYNMASQLENIHYVDRIEYEITKNGIAFIQSLPFQFSFTNQSFSSFKELEKEEQENTLFAYILENKDVVFDCYQTKCASLEKMRQYLTLNSLEIQMDALQKEYTVFVNGIGYGVWRQYKGYYKLENTTLKDTGLTKLSKFHTYKKDKDNYLFYFYQGYYNKDKPEELYDYISGKQVKDMESLQLYKYVLTRKIDGSFSLKSFNPVKGIAP